MYKFQTEKVQRSHSKGYRRESLIYFFSACELPPFVLVFLYRLLLVYKHLYQRWLAVCQCVSCFSFSVFLFFFFKKGSIDGRRWRGGIIYNRRNGRIVCAFQSLKGGKKHIAHIILLCLIWFHVPCSILLHDVVVF